MFYFQVYRPLESVPAKFQRLFEDYWIGLYKNGSLMNRPVGSFGFFTQFLPLLWLSFQFLPSFVYATILSARFFGNFSLYKIYIENAVFFIFSLLTNISFFSKTLKNNPSNPPDVDVEDEEVFTMTVTTNDDPLKKKKENNYPCLDSLDP